ncbi:sigma-70 family RNA polymerase sigma factor [Clostridium cadaveris]|uniref:sigma-70 family RNA polymerase sigma factor n=1 Tax=Clostridium cadaveris TaxID=1529 RepID=UPI0015B59579|nr:sigma-70 family RNA polymerase sigma factor [Clostridium cadaveris]NWK12975.1 sigma-70 family RNA polymerase sigma factor [Clostridium cadaveris]
MKKRLNINGEIVEMNFEQAYEQFAAFRHKMQIKWNRMPMDMEDLKQEIDIAFYRAFLKYDERFNDRVAFLTYVYRYIDSNIGRLFRDMNNDKRVINIRAISYNAMVENDDNKEMSLETKVCVIDSFEEELISELDAESYMSKLDDRDKKVVEMLNLGYTQSEIGKKIGVRQNYVSRIKTKIIKKLREEIAS